VRGKGRKRNGGGKVEKKGGPKGGKGIFWSGGIKGLRCLIGKEEILQEEVPGKKRDGGGGAEKNTVSYRNNSGGKGFGSYRQKKSTEKSANKTRRASKDEKFAVARGWKPRLRENLKEILLDKGTLGKSAVRVQGGLI